MPGLERCELLWNGSFNVRWCYEIDCYNTELNYSFDTCNFGPWDSPMWYAVHRASGCEEPCVIVPNYAEVCSDLYESVEMESYKVNGSMNCVGLFEMAMGGYFTTQECERFQTYVPDKCGCPTASSPTTSQYQTGGKIWLISIVLMLLYKLIPE